MSLHTWLYRDKELSGPKVPIAPEPKGKRVIFVVYRSFWLVSDITDTY